MIKKFLSEYLSFTRKERAGIIFILILILVFTFLPFFFPYFISSKPQDVASFKNEIAKIKIHSKDSSSLYTEGNSYDKTAPYYNYTDPRENNNNKKPAGELFYFDPNTLDAGGWKKLGIREKTIFTIQHYLSRGGKFHEPEDIGKIWGLHEDEVQRLMPFVTIPKPSPGKNAVQRSFEKTAGTKKEYITNIVEINKADTSAFIALPGIGSKLAGRIIAFRDKLGGFYKVEQVAETFALPDSTFQKIKGSLVLTNATVKQLNINTATFEELKAHPYIRYSLANSIIRYRTEHGRYSAVSDIKKILFVTDDVFDKLAPYLIVK